jgi:hypothetical protein
MQKPPTLATQGTSLLGLAALLMGVAASGCKKTDDEITNTGHSSYIGTGDTRSDQIANDRAKAHRVRLPGAGATGN